DPRHETFRCQATNAIRRCRNRIERSDHDDHTRCYHPARGSPDKARVMKEPTVVRLEETERVSFGPLSHYQLIIGDDEGTTPVRTGIQTAQPGYAAPVHQHPYVEILHIH